MVKALNGSFHLFRPLPNSIGKTVSLPKAGLSVLKHLLILVNIFFPIC